MPELPHMQEDRARALEALGRFFKSPRGRVLLRDVLSENDGELARVVRDRIRRDPSWAEG